MGKRYAPDKRYVLEVPDNKDLENLLVEFEKRHINRQNFNYSRLLEKTVTILKTVNQDPPYSTRISLLRISRILITDEFILHHGICIQILVALCICELIRITAPDSPYDANHRKVVFKLFLVALKLLPAATDYEEPQRILDTMAKYRSFVLMISAEASELIIEMFHLFLNSIRSDHPYEVFRNMKSIMTMTIEERDHISFELLEPLLASVRRDNRKISWALAKIVIENCATKLQPYLRKAVKSKNLYLDDYDDIIISLCQITSDRGNMANISRKEEEPVQYPTSSAREPVQKHVQYPTSSAREPVQKHVQYPTYPTSSAKEPVPKYVQYPTSSAREPVQKPVQYPSYPTSSAREHVQKHVRYPTYPTSSAKEPVQKHVHYPTYTISSAKEPVQKHVHYPTYTISSAKEPVQKHVHYPTYTISSAKELVQKHVQYPNYPTSPAEEPVQYPAYPTSSAEAPVQEPVQYPTSPAEEPVQYPSYPTSPAEEPVQYLSNPTYPAEEPVEEPGQYPAYPTSPASPAEDPVQYPTYPTSPGEESVQEPVQYPTYPTSPAEEPVQEPVQYPTSPAKEPVEDSNEMVDVDGFKVKAINAPILSSIFAKYGNIAIKSLESKSRTASLLDGICDIVHRLQDCFIEDILLDESIENEISAVEAVMIRTSWLRDHLANLKEISDFQRDKRMLKKLKSV